MDKVCLLIDIDKTGLEESWSTHVQQDEFPLTLSYASRDEVAPMLETGSVVCIVIFSENSHPDVVYCLNQFVKYVGAISDFQAIVSTDPDPNYASEVFEFGVENFLSPNNWTAGVKILCQTVVERLESIDSVEKKTMNLSQNIAFGDQSQIQKAQQALGDAYTWDYVAAYAKANALQAEGKYSEAADLYRNSQEMNKLFRPASNGLSESLLVLGKFDEAILILEKLEAQNPRHVERKAHLAIAYMEKGQKEKAEQLLADAESIDPLHPKIREARAEILLVEGKVNEAFKMMDTLHEVGPFFAAKLNEMGIKLSQQGKGKSAMALYKKAHKIVRQELRYKISLNAALACYRMAEYQIALQYLLRTEKEFGGTYEKVEKVRLAIKKQLSAAATKSVS